MRGDTHLLLSTCAHEQPASAPLDTQPQPHLLGVVEEHPLHTVNAHTVPFACADISVATLKPVQFTAALAVFGISAVIMSVGGSHPGRTRQNLSGLGFIWPHGHRGGSRFVRFCSSSMAIAASSCDA